jgi:hypothetical protein
LAETAPVQARDQVQTRQRAVIVGGLEHPQPPIQFIKESMIGGRNRVSEVLYPPS